MNRLNLKRKMAMLWPACKKGNKIILLYHSVGNTPWAIDKALFYNQISWLVDHYSVLSLSTLIHSPHDNTVKIAITFDDGYQSLYQHIAPVLEDKKINATVYLTTGYIGHDANDRKQSETKLGHYPDESFLTWKEVKALHNAGWEIASHGINHYDFSLSEETLTTQELMDSKRDIETHLNAPCLHFSYPWGKYSTLTKKIVAQSGYRYAVAARHGQIDCHSDLLALPRINIAKEYNLKDFKDMIMGKWNFLGLYHKVKGL